MKVNYSILNLFPMLKISIKWRFINFRDLFNTYLRQVGYFLTNVILVALSHMGCFLWWWGGHLHFVKASCMEAFL